MPIQDNTIRYFAIVAVFVVLWSSAFAFGKMALDYSPPQLFLGFRFFLAGLLMIAFAVITKTYRAIGIKGWVLLAVLGALNQAGYQGLAWVAMEDVSSALVAVIISMNPIFIAILAVPILGEAMSKRRALGLALGITGVVIVLNSRITVSGEDIGGIVIAVIALGSVVLGTVLFKKFAIDAPISVMVGGQFLTSGILLSAIGLSTESLDAIQFGLPYWGLMAYFIFGVSMGGVGLWFYLLTHGNASDASALHFLMPPFGLFFGWILLGEETALGDFLGIIPIAIGIWLATHRKKPIIDPSEGAKGA